MPTRLRILPLAASALALLALLAACALPQPASNPGLTSPAPTLPPADPSPYPTTSPLPAETQTATPTASASAPTLDSADLLPARYSLAAQFDYFRHYLAVDETIVYPNHTGQPLTGLLLVVEPNRWPSGFVLTSLTWENGQPVKAYDLSGNQLSIPLPQPLLPGQSASLALSYELFLPEIPEPTETTRPVPYGYTLRQTNVVDWYPFVPPYRPGVGWLVHNPWYYGEHQVYDVADYLVELTLLEPVENLMIAASAPASQEGGHYRYTLTAARNFAWSASNLYQQESTHVGQVTVSSYYFTYDVSAGQAALQHTAEALALYSQLFAPYPHASLSVVEADFLDGMEYDGLYFLSRGFYNLYDGTPRGYLTAIAAHETAHQWWYGLVGNDQALEPWLDEALCTYSERLFYEQLYPEVLDWWWAFRVDYYQPSGWVDGTIYDYGGFRPYRDAVYLHGAEFLEDLRTLTGDQAFLAFLADYATRRSGSQVKAQDFFALLEEHSSADFSGLLEEYFQAP